MRYVLFGFCLATVVLLSCPAAADITITRSGSSWARIEDDSDVTISGSSVGRVGLVGVLNGIQRCRV